MSQVNPKRETLNIRCTKDLRNRLDADASEIGGIDTSTLARIILTRYTISIPIEEITRVVKEELDKEKKVLPQVVKPPTDPFEGL